MAFKRSFSDPLLIIALAAGKTVAEAAAEAHVSLRTAKRRLADPEFRQQVAETQARMTAAAIDNLIYHGEAASSRLTSLLDSKSESVQLSAARVIINGMLKLQNRNVPDGHARAIQPTPPAAPAPPVDECWPESVDDFPKVVGMSRQDELRHSANWLTLKVLPQCQTEEERTSVATTVQGLKDAALALDITSGEVEVVRNLYLTPGPGCGPEQIQQTAS